MIKWYCDVCKREIKRPENPYYFGLDITGKNRDIETFGWGILDDVIRIYCHKICAEEVGAAIKKVVTAIIKGK